MAPRPRKGRRDLPLRLTSEQEILRPASADFELSEWGAVVRATPTGMCCWIGGHGVSDFEEHLIRRGMAECRHGAAPRRRLVAVRASRGPRRDGGGHGRGDGDDVPRRRRRLDVDLRRTTSERHCADCINHGDARQGGPIWPVQEVTSSVRRTCWSKVFAIAVGGLRPEIAGELGVSAPFRRIGCEPCPKLLIVFAQRGRRPPDLGRRRRESDR